MKRRLEQHLLDIYYKGSVVRLLGRFGHKIDYRHVIWSLVRKPGAFRTLTT